MSDVAVRQASAGDVEPLASFEASAALTYIERVAEVAARRGQPYLATVVAESAGLVEITRAGDDASDDQEYARVAGFGVVADDLVLVADVGGKEPIVIGKVLAASPAYNIVREDLRLYSGADLAGYSDAGTTQKWSIDGATGAVTGGSFNSPVVASSGQSNADTTSTTSTSAYADAMTLAVTLPAGTWSIAAVGGLGAKHSADLGVRLDVEINGVEGTARTINCPSAAFRMIVDNATVGALAGGGSVNVKVRFRSSDAGTTTVSNPWVIAVATRTS